MKKIIRFLIIMVLIYPTIVFAQEYQTKQLISVDSVATVKTEKFTYQDFLYSSTLDDKGNARITFNSIVNNSVNKTPVSINLLLFGEDQKNIGIVTYCTDRDYGSNYDGFKLNGNQAVPFSINVVKTKYFVNGKTPGDVKYIAVLDENKYCKIGGYSNYEGLTIDEIANGIIPKERQGISLSKYVENLKESGLVSIILTVLGLFAGFIIYGMVLNVLYTKMYNKKTILAYIPITNVYVTFKLVFGNLYGLVAMIIYLIAVVLLVFNIPILFYIFGGLDAIAFIIVIIKLITGNYSLLYFDKKVESNSNVSFNNTKVNTIEEKPQEALDLSYDDKDISSEDISTDLNISSGEAVSNNVEERLEEKEEVKEENDEEESELSKFFE